MIFQWKIVSAERPEPKRGPEEARPDWCRGLLDWAS